MQKRPRLLQFSYLNWRLLLKDFRVNLREANVVVVMDSLAFG